MSTTGVSGAGVPAADGSIAAQAAAEYIGVAITGVFGAIGDGLSSLGRYVERNPALILVAVAALMVVLRVFRRRR